MPGAVAVVLHAHLPFVRHPEHDDFLEERWLFEAITECYAPLLEVLDGLERDGVAARLALSLSPTLLAMLDDALLRSRYLRHLDQLLALAEREERRTRADVALHRLAALHHARIWRTRSLVLDVWQQDLLSAFRGHMEAGRVELFTSAATHALLPLLRPSPPAVRAQIEVATAEFRRFFGRTPAGFWLPECGWDPGLDADLARAGIRWVVVDAHGLAHARPRPVYGAYAPVATPAGVAAFARDPDSAKQVWSSEDGYPGDPWYREFHRDIGFDLDDDLVRPFRPPGAPRIQTGIKYHRITGPGDAKALYDPERARDRVTTHAAHFVDARRRQVAWLERTMDRPPVVVCPYDAELFGHWWLEGPAWLDAVLRRLAAAPDVETTTPSRDLERNPVLQVAMPTASTWGWKGHHEVWLSPENDWIYRHLFATADRLHALCRRFPSAAETTRRALSQAVRELLLAQASDWAFMMSRVTTAEYAVRRTKDHLLRCQVLCDQVERGAVDEVRLAALEDADNCFPTVDYRVLL